MACPTDVIDTMARQPNGYWMQGIRELPDFRNSFWFNALPKGDYPVGAGLEPKKMLANRYLGDEFFDWRTLGASNGTGSVEDNEQAFLPTDTAANNPCCIEPYRLAEGFDSKVPIFREFAVDSRPICQLDLLHANDWQGQIQMRMEQYGAQLSNILGMSSRNEYVRQVNKIYTQSGAGLGGLVQDDTVGDVNGTTVMAYWGLDNTYYPTGALDQTLLDQVAWDLDFKKVKGIKTVDNTQVYPLITDAFTSRNLITKDANVREDIRFADMGEGDNARLLNGILIQRSFRGFSHVGDYGVRLTKVATEDAAWTTTYNSSTGVWTPVTDGYWQIVPRTIRVATESGYTEVPNKAWPTAPVAMSIVYSDDVVTESTPPGLKIDSKYRTQPLMDYMGQLNFVALNTTDDPYALYGRWYAMMVRSWQPLWNDRGYAIIHLNCNAVVNTDCAGYEGS